MTQARRSPLELIARPTLDDGKKNPLSPHNHSAEEHHAKFQDVPKVSMHRHRSNPAG
jgi:hypothetical protein